MTPRGHFTSLARRCRHAARYHDMARLQRYLASSDFIAALNAQEPMVRKLAIRVMSEALTECATPGRCSRNAARPRRSIRWDAPTIARFRKALFKSGLEAGAQAVGITVAAARMAVRRHATDWVAPTHPYMLQAA